MHVHAIEINTTTLKGNHVLAVPVMRQGLPDNCHQRKVGHVTSTQACTTDWINVSPPCSWSQQAAYRAGLNLGLQKAHHTPVCVLEAKRTCHQKAGKGILPIHR